jgi:hypothetical protein
VILGLILALLAVLGFRPGTSIVKSLISTPRSAPTATGVWFVVGQTDAGPTTPTLLQSMSDYAYYFGSRVSFSSLYDAINTFFQEGGAQVWVARTVGPAAVTASHNFLDGAAAVSLIVSAKGPGAGSDTKHGNSLKVAILAPVVSGFRVQVLDSASNALETSGDLATQQDAVNWSKTSQYVNISLGASALNPAVVAATSLTGGADDRTNITDTQRGNALALFTADLGPGQVSAPGLTTDSLHQLLVAHADANNRTAILDLPDTATAATLETSVVNTRSAGIAGAAFAPWLTTPGPTSGSVITVPPSAFIAALAARNDTEFNQDTPWAGDQGIAQYITGLSQPSFDDATRQNLNASGVNVIVSKYGAIRNYGWRSIVDPFGSNADWVDLGNVRLAMAIAAQADLISEEFLFSVLDGQGIDISLYQGALTAMLMDFWQAGSLFGATTADAFFVDVGSAVNTPQTLANNELHAVLNVKMSPMAEFVQINIVKVPIGQAV